MRGGGGQRQKNNTNHVIKYFPWKTTGIGRGEGGVAKKNNRWRIRVSVTKQKKIIFVFFLAKGPM